MSPLTVEARGANPFSGFEKVPTGPAMMLCVHLRAEFMQFCCTAPSLGPLRDAVSRGDSSACTPLAKHGNLAWPTHHVTGHCGATASHSVGRARVRCWRVGAVPAAARPDPGGRGESAPRQPRTPTGRCVCERPAVVSRRLRGHGPNGREAHMSRLTLTEPRPDAGQTCRGVGGCVAGAADGRARPVRREEMRHPAKPRWT